MRHGLGFALACTIVWAVFDSGAAHAAETAVVPPTQVRVDYRMPKVRAQRGIRERLRKNRTLEQFADMLRFVRLPHGLTLVAEGCDGVSNAWYDPEEGTITLCYEYVTELLQHAPPDSSVGVTHAEAVDGALSFIMLHEISHALFHLLRVPILGHEEDAADQVAAYILLHAGNDVAQKALRGAAWMYVQEAAASQVGRKELSDAHSLPSQLYYDVLCLAYGSDPDSYARAVTDRGLPLTRAEGCADEYQQVAYAVETLIAKNIDRVGYKRFRTQKTGPTRPAQ
jgi:hypothetical protein